MRQIAVENLDLFLECSSIKAVSRVELCDKVYSIQAVTLHKVILPTLAERSKFREGLSSLGVAEAVKKTLSAFSIFLLQVSKRAVLRYMEYAVHANVKYELNKVHVILIIAAQ